MIKIVEKKYNKFNFSNSQPQQEFMDEGDPRGGWKILILDERHQEYIHSWLRENIFGEGKIVKI